MSKRGTAQETFWEGEFGNDYAVRNSGLESLRGIENLFKIILSYTAPIGSIIGFGANVGLNIMTLKTLLPDAEISAVEINQLAVTELRKQKDIKIYHQSILDFVHDYARDFVLIKCVLMHINPERVHEVYDTLYQSSKRYICVVEYYNPTPVEVEYRGYSGMLFKRDFAGELLDRFEDLRLVKYGFSYHRDKTFSEDDSTWFLLEKNI